VAEGRSSIRAKEWGELGWPMVGELRDAKPKRVAKVRGRGRSCPIPQGVVKCRGRKLAGAESAISWSTFFLFFFFSFFLFFFFSFLNQVLLVNVQELACIVRYGVKKTLIPNNCPLQLFMGKIKHPESIGKSPVPST